MTAQIGDTRKLLAIAFREARELLDLSVVQYSKLFESEPSLIQRLEEGMLPTQLDDRLLKLILATVAVRHRVDFLEPLLLEAKTLYACPDLFEYPFPLLYLFGQVLGPKLACYPWVSEGAVFRCRLLQLTDQANGILLWAESDIVHRALTATLPGLALAHLDLIDGYTIIFIPNIYLFLKLDTTSSRNPLPKTLSQRLKEELPVGIAVPREPFTHRSPSDIEVARASRRLFIYSRDPGSIREILAR
ncbi:MAG: hypothetical protein AB1489_03395 [Acidobacteriota bacterium]